MNYKSFREQLIKCKENGNLREEKCNWCGKVLLMCVKYGGQCVSSKCRDERTEQTMPVNYIIPNIKKEE